MVSQALTTTEQQELDGLVATVKAGQETFINVGYALIAIRDKKLYRQDSPTFEGFCQVTFGFTRHRAHQLMGAAEVIGEIRDSAPECLPLVNNERQARALADAPKGERATALKEAADHAPKNGKGKPRVTAKRISETVKVKATRIEPEPVREFTPPAPKPDPEPWQEHNDLLEQAISLAEQQHAIFAQIRDTKFGGWRSAKEDDLFLSNFKAIFENNRVTGWKPLDQVKGGDNFYRVQDDPKQRRKVKK